MQNNEFPREFNDELFVALFGNAFRMGRDIKGKKIVKIKINQEATGIKSHDEFVTYIGDGPAAPCGLTFGPGGLYFTDLHGEKDEKNGKNIGNIFRVKKKKENN